MQRGKITGRSSSKGAYLLVMAELGIAPEDAPYGLRSAETVRKALRRVSARPATRIAYSERGLSPMMTDPTPTAPSTPNPTTTALVAMAIRYALMGLSAAGIATAPHLTDGAIMGIASALVGAATCGWALYERFQTARKAHEGAVMSAQLRAPVAPK
jgi:hypothetical protein